MKKTILILAAVVLLVGCVRQDEVSLENDLVNQLDKSADAFIAEQVIETETEFGTEEEVVLRLKEEIGSKDEVEMESFSENLVKYGSVATEVEVFHNYLLAMSVLMAEYPEMLSTDEWQNLQEQWQELNDPID